ncbi:hypothetical protein BC829DRAFT_438889 [Chytridium lagenaria]|nr:hypothetical protein BC829DRAFT_438889 [Chytridium lagenaria]
MAKKKKGGDDKTSKKLLKKEKQLKKAEKTAKKDRKKQKDEEEVEDIDSILAQLEKEQAELTQISNVVCDPPSRRICGSLCSNPKNLNEIVMFGGEFYDGQKVQLYNDLFVYNIEKNEWRKITSPNSPGPRSSHQLTLAPSGRAFLFGGEFVSPNQTTFFHYKDFWSLDLNTYAWRKLEVGKKPSPRSGHRQILWKNYIFVFGGFYDTGHEVRYLNDLHVFDIQECKWQELVVPEPKPTKRSGFQLVLHNDTMVLYGGYAKEAVKGQKEKGVVYTDIWHMKLSFQFDALRWERQKKAGFTPDPRSGSTMAYCKSRAYMFGGVLDVKEDEEKIESICTDDMFQLNIEQNRFYPVSVNRKPAADGRVNFPSSRFNSMLCVVKAKIYLFGGTLERGSKEVTYGDFWALDLDKGRCDTECIVRDEAAGSSWLGTESDSESGESDSEDDDEDSDDDDEDDDDESDEEEDKRRRDRKKGKEIQKAKREEKAKAAG